MSRRRAPEQTYTAIIDAAIQLFLEKGYEQTTTTDILKAAGDFSRGAFYHHFESKQAVLQAIPNRLLQSDTVYQEVLYQKQLNGLKKIQKLFCRSMERFLSKPEDQLFARLLSEPNMLAEQMQMMRKQTIPLYEQLICEGNQDGSIHVADPKAAAQLTAVLLNIWCMPILPGTAAEYYQRFVLLRSQLAALGMDFIDDEVLALCRKVADMMEQL